MKLKKLLTFSVMALAVAMTASSAPFSNYRIYLNPGHGGHDSDDRPTPQPLNTPMFYESDGNLTRGLYMRDMFKLYGATVGITRTQNRTADDLDLTYIATLSNNFGGWFISPHTNGGNASANYTSAFYKGQNGQDFVSGSKAMGQAMVNQHHAVELTNTTYSTPRSLADYDMWGWHYGILRTNNRPGILVESWFHDYRPESLRLKSNHYNRFLGWQLCEGFLNSPVGGSGMKGAIVGDCRDLTQGCGYTNYATRGRDSYKAINGVKVTLKNASGSIVSVKNWSASSGDDASYYATQSNPQMVDNYNNGVFFFDELTAGTYIVEVQVNGYSNQSKTVTVSNDHITKCCFDMKQGTSSGISPSVTLWETSANVGATSSKSVTVSASGLSADISISITGTNANQFSVSPTTIAKTGGSFTITYRPTAAGGHSANVVLTSGTHKESIAVTGTAKNPPLTFSQGWNYSETSGQAAPWAADYTHMRNMDYANGKLYVVDPGKAIYIINAQTGAKMGELSMQGVSGGALSIVDVKCAGGDKIVGCNVATNAENLNTFKIYCWDNDMAAPRVILSTTDFAGKARIGDCIDLRGNLTNGSFSFAAGSTSEDNVVLTYKITNGVVATSPTSVALKDETGANGIKLGLSPRIVPEQNEQFWGIGQNYLPTLFMADGKTRATLNSDVLADIAGNCITAFNYKGTSYGLITDYQAGSSQAERLKGGRAVLVDATNGWAKAEKIGEYPSAGLGQTRNTSLSSSLCSRVDGSNGVEIWVLVHNQGIAYFKAGSPSTLNPTLSGDPTAPALSANPPAVSLNVVEGQQAQATVTFTGANLTQNISLALSGAEAAMFSLDNTSLPAAGGTVTITYAPNAQGNHSATITASAGTASATVSIAGKCTPYEEPMDESKFVFSKINETTTGVVARADGRFSTGYGDYVYMNDKANGQVVRYDKNGTKSVYASVEGVGTAISSDDAGNIIVDKGFSGVGSSTNWVIIEPNGTQTALTFEGFTAARLDHVGRTVGNVASAQGGYLYLTPNSQNAVIAIKIANKAFVSATASPAISDVTFDATAVAQPMFKTVAEVEAASNKGATAYARVRGKKNIYSWEGTNSVSLGAATGSTTSDGFDVFELNGKKYSVEPAGTNYSDAFVIRRLTDNEIVATKNLNLLTEANPSFQSLTARVSENGRYVIIYQNLAGKLVAQYRYGMPDGGTPVQQVAAPTFTPAAGTYAEAQNVTIACATQGADIYYTLDGNNPTTSSTKYTAPIAISATTTVKAIAVKSGMTNSIVASATYTISGGAPVAPAAPTFTPAAGTYTTTQNVTIACATEGAEIRYTLDGSNPTATSALYDAPIAISQTTTIKAIAFKDGLSSAIAVAAYTIQGETPEPPVGELTLVWEQKFSTPGSSDARFATGFGGVIYAAQKATSDAPGKIIKYAQGGVSDFATVEGMGTAITSDDAGNILVNKGFPGVGSSTNWVIIEPNGTQHELTIELPSGIEACRVDQVGRVVGNVMSADGGYMFIAGNAQTAVAAIKIANGAQDTSASAASPTVAVIMNTSTLAQPMFETVDDTEAFVDPSAAFYSRNRGANKLFSWLDDGSEQFAMDNAFGAGGNEGFDVIAYGEKLYGVVSLARTSEFTLRDVTNAEQVASGGSAEEAVSHQFRAYALRKDGNLCGIYVWNAGHSARYYTINLSGVESVAGGNAVEVAATYYNLQGVRVTNPSAGQIYIRVANLSDGTVRTSKVIVR